MEKLTQEQEHAIELIKSGADFICSSFTDEINEMGEPYILEKGILNCRGRHIKKHLASLVQEMLDVESTLKNILHHWSEKC